MKSNFSVAFKSAFRPSLTRLTLGFTNLSRGPKLILHRHKSVDSVKVETYNIYLHESSAVSCRVRVNMRNLPPTTAAVRHLSMRGIIRGPFTWTRPILLCSSFYSCQISKLFLSQTQPGSLTANSELITSVFSQSFECIYFLTSGELLLCTITISILMRRYAARRNIFITFRFGRRLKLCRLFLFSNVISLSPCAQVLFKSGFIDNELLF